MKKGLLGFALTALSAGAVVISSQMSLASNLQLSQVAGDAAPVELRMDRQPILVSVASNWTSKLPSVRNKIIGELEGRLGKLLAQGNQGSARVEALRVEGSNLYVKVLIHHKHEPGRKWGVPLGVPYSLQTWVETKYNPLDTKSTEDSTKLCVRGPKPLGSPNFCVTAGEVRRIISAFL